MRGRSLAGSAFFPQFLILAPAGGRDAGLGELDVESRDSESRIERGKEKRMVWFWFGVVPPAGKRTMVLPGFP